MKKLLLTTALLAATFAHAQTHVKTLFGRGKDFDLVMQLETQNATVEMKGANIAATFAQDGRVTFKPSPLRDGNAVAITLKNTGDKPVTPKLQAESLRDGNKERTDLATPEDGPKPNSGRPGILSQNPDGK